MSDDNIWTDQWDVDDDWSGGGAQSKRLPRGDDLGATVYELGPGNFVVYHFHHGSEELLVVLRAARRCGRAKAAGNSTRVRSCTSRQAPTALTA